MPVSKHDLKHFSKSDIFGFTGGAFMDLKCVLMILICCVMILKRFFNGLLNDLSRRSKNFERDTCKGGGAL